MKQRTKVLLGVALALAIIAGVFFATRGDGVDADVLASPGSTGASSSESRKGQPSHWGEAEDEVWASALAPNVTFAGRYRLVYGHTMRMLKGGEHAGLPPESQMSFNAELELAQAPEPHGREGWLVGRLIEVVVSGDESLLKRAGLPKCTAEDACDAIEAPFMVRFDQTGAAVERRYSESMPSGARNVLGSILTGLQVVVPEDTKVVDGRWEATEEALDGPLTARYGIRSGGLTKTWRRDIGANGWTLDAPGKLVSEGAAEWFLSFSGDTQRLNRATLQVGLVGDVSMTEELALEFSSDTTATLVRVGEGVAVWAAEVSVAGLSGRDGAAEVEAKVASARALPAPSGRSPALILAESQRANESRDSQARRAAMLDLAATIRADEGALAYVEGQLRGETSADGLRTMVEALASAGTEASLGTMNTLLADAEVPNYTRHSIAAMVAFMSEPTPELIATLTELSRQPLDSLSTAALNGLAIQGNLEHEHEQTAMIREDVLSRAKEVLAVEPSASMPGEPAILPAADTDPALLQAWLQAVGNLGGPEAWPLIMPYMKHPNEWVRFSAVGGLIRVPGQEVRLAVAEMIEKDSSHWVRRRAVQTAGNMPQAAFESLIIRTMRSDEAANVRLECARVLAVWGFESPGLYPLIAEAALREPDRTTRKIMGQLQPELIGTPGVDDRTLTPSLGPNELTGGTP